MFCAGCGLKLVAAEDRQPTREWYHHPEFSDTGTAFMSLAGAEMFANAHTTDVQTTVLKLSQERKLWVTDSPEDAKKKNTIRDIATGIEAELGKFPVCKDGFSLGDKIKLLVGGMACPASLKRDLWCMNNWRNQVSHAPGSVDTATFGRYQDNPNGAIVSVAANIRKNLGHLLKAPPKHSGGELAKLCRHWQQTGLCPWGEKCHFHHDLLPVVAEAGGIKGGGAQPPPNLLKRAQDHHDEAEEANSRVPRTADEVDQLLATGVINSKAAAMIKSALRKLAGGCSSSTASAAAGGGGSGSSARW